LAGEPNVGMVNGSRILLELSPRKLFTQSRMILPPMGQDDKAWPVAIS